jgi:hypothetical protein
MKIRISLSKPGLFLNKENFRQARGNKHAGMIIMDPEDFLQLTVTNQRVYNLIMSDARTLAEYNQHTKTGQGIHPPWLYISLDGYEYRDEKPTLKPGQVCGHEGRHRAAALIKEGITKMPVSLRLYVKGIERQCKPTPDDPWGHKNKWTRADIPSVFYGQFNQHTKAKINVATFKAY